MDFIVTFIHWVTYIDVSHFSKSEHIWSFRVNCNKSQSQTTSCTKIDLSAYSIIRRIKIIQNYIYPYHIRGAFSIFCPWWFSADWCIWDLCHLGIVNYNFCLSKDKIQYRYDHLFAHRMRLHNQTLIHCRFNVSRKQDKSPGKYGGICWLDIVWL